MKSEHEDNLTPATEDQAISDQVLEHRAAIQQLGRFGIVIWSEKDIVSALVNAGAAPSPENIDAVREHSYVEHISDRMTEVGWVVIEHAVHDLGLAGGNAPNKEGE
jgi:hypothetical protein